MLLAHLESTNLSQANLRGASLFGAHLEQATLIEADLRLADLSHTNLKYTNLTGANLRSTDQMDTCFTGAILADVKMNWMSRSLISERLYREAATLEQKAYSAMIARETGYCWEQFEKEFPYTFKFWAVNIMYKWIQKGDRFGEVFEDALHRYFKK